VTMEEFARMVHRKPPLRTRIPLIGMAKAGTGGYFDDAGFPAGAGWDELEVPGITDENAYAPTRRRAWPRAQGDGPCMPAVPDQDTRLLRGPSPGGHSTPSAPTSQNIFMNSHMCLFFVQKGHD